MLIKFKDTIPVIHPNVFVAENSTIIGNCHIEENASIWFNAVIRADVNKISIGSCSNVQDNCVLHCDDDYSTEIGHHVTIGHSAIVHGCKVGNNCIIGMGSTILDGAIIGNNVIIGANALITSGKVIPDNSLVVGSPGKVARMLTEDEIQAITHSAEAYANLRNEYK